MTMKADTIDNILTGMDRATYAIRPPVEELVIDYYNYPTYHAAYLHLWKLMCELQDQEG